MISVSHLSLEVPQFTYDGPPKACFKGNIRLVSTQQLVGEARGSLRAVHSGTIFNCVRVSLLECTFAGEAEPPLGSPCCLLVMCSVQIKAGFVPLPLPVIHLPSAVRPFSVPVCFVMLTVWLGLPAFLVGSPWYRTAVAKID